MLSALGYLIISVILIILVAVAGRIYINLSKKEVENLFMGPLTKEISDLIIENGRKFIPIGKDSTLLYVIAGVCIVLIFIVNAVLIK